ncbi:hypothetical protein SSX86_028340 [Deinandra increscens subsp. villosa]|uniref:Uncharacterized protein n=1 Tax=Deinandra increscens subsp. villosa TaxID=3103831 RepID=A0AAP0CDW8_9ASTR
MAKPTSQWACIAILALMGSTFTMAHMVMPPMRPIRSRELQMDKNREVETSSLKASEPAGKSAQQDPSLMDKNDEVEASNLQAGEPAGKSTQHHPSLMDKNGEVKTSNLQASELAGKSAQHHPSLMDKNGETETSKLQASEPAGKTAQHHPSQMDRTEANVGGCGGSREDKGVYGGGHGSGITSIGFHNIYPFFGFPFGFLVPQVTTWGEGGGGGGVGSNNYPGTGLNCHCTHYELPMQYVMAPIYFQPMSPASPNNMRKDGPGEPAPGQSHN